MRPILVNIPSKLLFVALVIAAAGIFVWDWIRKRSDPARPYGSTPLYLLVGAEIIMGLKSRSWIPGTDTLSEPWSPVPIYAYGVMLGTSLFVGWFLALRLAKQDGMDRKDTEAIYMWSALWSIIGSRILWYLTDGYKGASPFVIFKIWEGGLVAYGGMIGGFIASWYGCRKRGIPLLQWADVSAPSVVLGTGITRIGCFLFGCDYGARSNLPWAVRFPGPNSLAPHGSPAWQHHVESFDLTRLNAEMGSYFGQQIPWSYKVHPTQIYEALVGVGLFAVLMLIRRYRRFSGQVFLGWVLGYGILRPLIETVRDDEDRGLFTVPLFHVQLSTSQIIGLSSVVLGLILMVWLVRKYRRDPASLRLWELAPAGGAPAGDVGGKRRKKRR